jgi:acyl-CoA synthetase (NDP forming)
VELALIVVPAAAVLEVLEEGARAGIRVAVILSPPPPDPDDARRWQARLLVVAAARGIRLLGPHSFGVIRTDSV